MLEKDLLTRVLNQALQNGGDFAEIFIEKKQVNNIFCEDDKIEKINSGRETGAGIRLITGANTAYVYTNDLSEEGLIKAAQVISHVARTTKNLPSRDITLTLQKPRLQYNFHRPPENVGFEEKISHVMKANAAARRVSNEIRQVTVAIGDLHKQTQIANSNGELVEDDKARIRVLINCVAAREGVIQTGYESAGGVCGWELLDNISLPDMAEKAARRAITMLSARPAPAGRMAVVMSSEAGGTMVHEACGHGLEADLVQKGMSVYKNRLGENVAAPCVNVVDDGTLAGQYGTSAFDDEGTLTRRNVLIENGRLVQYMYDRLTALKEGRESTGNGRRESYQHKPVVRMTNTFIEPGQDNPEDIIKSTPRGLLVKKMGGGQVNTTNGDFVFNVQEGYLIENGKIKYPVRGAILSGNGPRVLMEIDRVGNDLGFAIGVCGKDGQGVAVADAQPTIRIKELTIGGTFNSKEMQLNRFGWRWVF
ncbi:MAG: TldD/PmbA family protein [Syntrophomonadaceae bacterium]|jgi:TldD protein